MLVLLGTTMIWVPLRVGGCWRALWVPCLLGRYNPPIALVVWPREI